MDKEYVIFNDVTSDGTEIELAVVDEFEYERKLYVASALVKDDEVDENTLFLYRLKENGKDDYEFEKIKDPKEYARVTKAYMSLG